MTRMAAAKPLHELLETEWDAQLFRGSKALAPMLGWTSYHTLRSKGSKTGYHDRTLVRDRILFVELKREPEIGKRGQPLKLSHDVTDDQRAWLDKLAAAGGEVYVWRPSDLDEIARILSNRWRPVYHISGRAPIALALASVDERWVPGSLWIPGVGRADTTEQQTLLTTKGSAAA
jgi:hypothetical protein